MSDPETPQNDKVFLSYSWKDSQPAEQIDSDLLQFQVVVTRDVRDLKYKQSLTAFMEGIRDSDFAILLISDSYLKSLNCMTEALHLLDEREFKKKLLPVVIDDAKIHDQAACLAYTAYWKDQIDRLSQAIETVAPTAALATLQKLKRIESVYARINEFIDYIADIKYLTFEDLRKGGYRDLLGAMGHVDVSHLVELLQISVESDLEKQESALEDWFDKHPPVSDAYGLRARIALRRGQVLRAEKNYERALKLSPDNPVALNNLGNLLWHTDKDIPQARELFERAIAAMPTLTEARLNLGVLLSDRFGDREGAQAQYEAIISFNPGEARAYNNLANLLRGDSNEQQASAEIMNLFETALNLQPGYFEARLNYINHLSETVEDLEAAREQLAMLKPETAEQKEIVNLLARRVELLRTRAGSSAPTVRSRRPVTQQKSGGRKSKRKRRKT